MPNDVREAYQIEKVRPTIDTSKSLTDFVKMSDELRDIYERAQGKVEKRSAPSQPLKDLPKTEDIYRQSAPPNMKNLPSDESVYRPAAPLTSPSKPAIEPDNGVRRLAMTLFVIILLSGLAFFVFQYMQ